jgi:hypothetical protein
MEEEVLKKKLNPAFQVDIDLEKFLNNTDYI